MSLKIFPYNMGSESAKQLAEVLQVKRVRSDGNFVPKHFMHVLNWGNSENPDWIERAYARSVPILNKPSAVNIAANKLSTFRQLHAAGIPIPEFTTVQSTAQDWLNSGATVMERHILRGNSGDGIRIVNLDDEDVENYLTHAPLYTKFINKTAEFRVHVFRGEVIDIVQKKKVTTDRRTETFCKYISSTHRGWVFARQNILDTPELRNIAIRAVSALGLDFGAVDIVYLDNRYYVLEVNTSPGLAGTTLVRYANAIRRYMGQPNLSDDVVTRLTSQESSGLTTTSPAAVSASVGVNVPRQSDDVILRLDRQTALKLRSLLATI